MSRKFPGNVYRMDQKVTQSLCTVLGPIADVFLPRDATQSQSAVMRLCVVQVGILRK